MYTSYINRGSSQHFTTLHVQLKQRLFAHHTLKPNMYHDNRGRLSAHQTIITNKDNLLPEIKLNHSTFQTSFDSKYYSHARKKYSKIKASKEH